MSFTYTQTQTNPNFGRLNLSAADLYIKSIFGDKNRASLIFDSNVTSGNTMTFGPDAFSDSLVSTNRVKAPNFQASTLGSSGGIITTDSTGLLVVNGGFTIDDGLFTIGGNVVVNGDLTVEGTIEFTDISVTNVFASTVITEELNANTAAFDLLNLNRLQVADIHANGDNINFYGPRMNVSGNLFAAAFIGDGSQLTNLNVTSTLQDVTENGATSDRTVSLTNATTGLNVSSNVIVGGRVTAGLFSGNVSASSVTTDSLTVASADIPILSADEVTVSGNVIATTFTGGTVISEALNSNTAAMNLLNLNRLQVADIHANGDNINFYGPSMNVAGNITSASLTTDAVTSELVQATGVLAQSLDVSGATTFSGVTTISVMKFTPGGIDPQIASPAAVYTGTAGGIISVTATGVIYGSATISDATGTVTGLNITGLSPNGHLYLYVNGSQTFGAPTDGLTYLSSFTGAGHAVYHVFNIGGKVFVDMTKVN